MCKPSSGALRAKVNDKGTSDVEFVELHKKA